MAFRLSVIWCEQFVKFLSNNCLMHLSINCVINFCNRKWLLNTKKKIFFLSSLSFCLFSFSLVFSFERNFWPNNWLLNKLYWTVNVQLKKKNSLFFDFWQYIQLFLITITAYIRYSQSCSIFFYSTNCCTKKNFL